VRAGCNPQLDAMRETYGRLHEILRSAGAVVLRENPLLDELEVQYVPQIGFLVAVARQGRSAGAAGGAMVPPSPHVPPDFEFAFGAGDTDYYKVR
ncbi:unnamed protein product, partial [Phaeothamnion confervicola]